MRCPKCQESLPEKDFKCPKCGNRLDFSRIPPPPKQMGLVNDYDGLLSGDYLASISRLVHDFEKKAGIEIVITVMSTTRPLTPDNYAFFMFNRWKLGKKKHEAILMLLAMQERRIETEIGYGLEKIISEEYTEKLLDEIVVPYFKQMKYGEGLYESIRDLIRELEERLAPSNLSRPVPSPSASLGVNSVEGVEGPPK